MGGTPALGARRAASGVLLARNSSGAWTGLVVFARAAERALEPQQSTAKMLTIEPHDLGDAPRALRVRSAPAARRVSGPTATRRHVAAATSQSARARKRARESHRVGGGHARATKHASPPRGRGRVAAPRPRDVAEAHGDRFARRRRGGGGGRADDDTTVRGLHRIHLVPGARELGE